MPDAYPRYVIPPYILRRIVDRGSLQQQRCAQNTLSHVQTLMAHVPGRPAAPTSPRRACLNATFMMPGRPRIYRVLRSVLRDSPPTATLPLMKPMTISASPMIFSGRATSAIRWITAD